MKWFRLYSDVLHNPKVQKLHPATFKHWVNILCLVSENSTQGELPDMQTIAFALRMKPNEADVIVQKLVAVGLVDRAGVGLHLAHNWARHQHLSDDVTAKSRRYRKIKSLEDNELQKNATVHATEMHRPVDTDTDTDTDTEKKLLPSVVKKKFETDSEAYSLAKLLFEKIKLSDPKFAVRDLQPWAAEMDKLLRIDRREYSEAIGIVEWCQDDDFWKSNILSATKLRAKYAQLRLKSQARSGGGDADMRRRLAVGAHASNEIYCECGCGIMFLPSIDGQVLLDGHKLAWGEGVQN